MDCELDAEGMVGKEDALLSGWYRGRGIERRLGQCAAFGYGWHAWLGDTLLLG